MTGCRLSIKIIERIGPVFVVAVLRENMFKFHVNHGNHISSRQLLTFYIFFGTATTTGQELVITGIEILRSLTST